MINLLVASDKEFQTIRTLFSTIVGIKETECFNTIAGYYNDKQISIYQIGIGKTNTCRSLHFLSELEGEFINIGTCCSLTMDLKIGQPVQVVSCCQWDFNVLEGPGILNSTYLPRSKYQTLRNCRSPFKKVNCATGDSFVTSDKRKYLLENFEGIHVVDMEIAAINDFFKEIHPIKSFKVISDYADMDQYNNCWDKIERGFKQILDFITKDKEVTL